LPVVTRAIGPLDFPIYYNTSNQRLNLASTTESLEYEISLTGNIEMSSSSFLTLPILNISSTILANTVVKGDVFQLRNMVVGTASTINMSGQYGVESVSSTNIILDMSGNTLVKDWVATNVVSSTLSLNDKISSKPYLSINRGSKWRITRITAGEADTFGSRYLIQKL
jgi:hypothetical protein